VSVDQPDQPAEQGPGGADSPPDTGGSRPSKNRCHADSDRGNDADLSITPSDMGAGALRPLAVRPETTLRDEARVAQLDGRQYPLGGAGEIPAEAEIQARPWYRVVSEFRRWYAGYLNSHIEYESPEGEIERTALENSYMPEYGDRYYAKLMDVQRGVNRQWEDLTTVMLTFSASTLNGEGQPRCPADHMREVAEGWGSARKLLHKALSGRNWEYAKVWEPTTEDGEGPAGYGHMHVAVFVEDVGDLEAGEFAPVMRSYVSNTPAAGWEAHRPEGDSVSVVRELEEANLGTYISEYIGSYGKETLERPIHEQAFYAAAWASRTRRVEFSTGAQKLMKKERFRRETGLRPEDRGGEAFEEWCGEGGREAAESDESGEESEAVAGVEIDPEAETVERVDEDSGESGEWSVTSLCNVRRGEPHRYDPTTGAVEAGEIDGRPGRDLPRDVGGPPPGR
jgi:hypothetical protein